MCVHEKRAAVKDKAQEQHFAHFFLVWGKFGKDKMIDDQQLDDITSSRRRRS